VVIKTTLIFVKRWRWGKATNPPNGRSKSALNTFEKLFIHQKILSNVI
jgi:hypothetical protein